MTKDEQISRAENFRAMHRSPPVLLLPNAWDAMSARIFEDAGFPAVATTSGGLAWALGYGDGEHAPWDEVVGAVRRIVQAVDVPVSADIEKGYGETANHVAGNVREIVAAGAIGINIEDGVALSDPKVRSMEKAAERVRAARQAADEAGVPIVINARTDVYALKRGEPQDQFNEVVQRAEAYLEAGADCIFVFGLSDIAVAGRLAATINAPINLIGRAGMPPAAELEKAGISRISVASGPALVIMQAVHDLAAALKETGDFDYGRPAMPRPQAQKLFGA